MGPDRSTVSEVTVVGDLLTFDGRRVELPGPLEELLADDDIVVAVTRETTDQQQRNVLALEPDGERRWRVDAAPHGMRAGDRRSPWYLAGWFAGDELWVRNANGRLYRLNRETGVIEDAVPSTELPVGDATVELEFPVERFVRTDGLTVALLDYSGDEGGIDENPGPRNVVAVEPDGTERWRIEDLGVEDRSRELWSEDDSPAKLAQTNMYDGLRIDAGDLVVEHRFGLEGVVDPATGVVTPRGVAEVDDRIVFGDHDVVTLPDPVWGIVELDDLVVARTACRREAAVWRTRNVVAFDRRGNRQWRIDEPTDDADPGAIDALWPVGGRLLVHSSAESIYEVERGSGAILAGYEPTEFPFEGRVRSFPYPVSSVAERDGVVAICLDAYGEGSYVEEPIASDECVLAFDESGEHLWQVDPIGNEDVFTGISRDGEQLRAHSFDGRSMHIDWETGEWRLSSTRLW